MKKKILIFFFLFFISCLKNKKVEEQKIPKSYFPISNGNIEDSLFNAVFSKILKDDFRESSLYEAMTENEIYRISKLSNNLYSEIIKIQNYNHSLKIDLKILGILDTCYIISNDKFDLIKNNINDCLHIQIGNEITNDSDIWIVEKAFRTNYQYNYRWIRHDQKDQQNFYQSLNNVDSIVVSREIRNIIYNRIKNITDQ
ncbi:hypothetical protein [Apibacter sp. HY039]|uniref:hypothetical protein n=1 Tax=Apibacter sp. HY039 TaxID=2501476 RepID=UPI000FEBC7AC|nr:hypothetical protein [Apibacter sp. HY039]